MNKAIADAIKALFANYAKARDWYYQEVFVAVYDYLDASKAVTAFQNAMKKAMAQAFTEAAEIGWQDGGGELPLDEDTSGHITAMQSAEFGYIDALFQTLKKMRGTEGLDKTAEATRRADGYARTLDGIYNHAKLAAAKNKMLTFVGEDGKESCTDCRRYKNKRRRARWWIENDAVPPNRSFECKGYNCQHVLVDDKGKVWTL